MKNGSYLLNGEINYAGNIQILESDIFKELVCELIEETEKKKGSIRVFFNLFIKDSGVTETKNKYDLNAISQLCLALASNTIEQIDSASYFSFPKLTNRKEYVLKFVEEMFGLWRSKQRFMIKNTKYTSNLKERIYKQMILAQANEGLRNLVLRVYREILINISDKRLKVLRQLPCGGQAAFMVDNPEFEDGNRLKNADVLYNLKYVWNMIFEPPVIFYTRSNTRSGTFRVIDKPILDKIKLKNPEEWFVFPILVCTQNIQVAVHKNYLAQAAGLGNLFELASFDYIKNSKIDGIYFMGMEKEWFKENPSGIQGYNDINGVIYKEENNGPYVGIVGEDASTDYFGYLKKMILTIHNLNVIDQGRLPVHGAMAEIKLLNGKKANVLMMGDSGAGKSETLDALLRIEDKISEVNVLIDDMGSLDITDEEKVVSYGTETGAFVRLDDLQPGYAYSAMDRSIFMNPTEINSRVIVPYSNYEEIIKPTAIDYFFYVNNYEEVKNEGEEVTFFEKIEDAIDVFSKGARMAKGTTSEKGLSTSYFANPFGAIQRKEKHEEIVKKYMGAMMKSGVKIGQVKSQLGINGMEHKGPDVAAKALLELIDKEK